MKRDEMNTEFYTELHISDAMVEELVADVRKGKRHADFRFRYSTAIIAAAIVAAVGFGGIGASAAYQAYKSRIEAMPEEEQAEYQQELEADTYAAVEEGRTRNFTDTEYKRYLELEDAYYQDGVFPEENIKHVSRMEEITADELAFVEEINKIHMPESEMTDEQLLQLIDHMAKYYYTIEQNAEAMGYVEEAGVLPEETESDIKTQSLLLIKKCFDVELDDRWEYSVYETIEPEDIDPDDEQMKEFAAYSVNFSESDAPNATFYQIIIPRYDGGLCILNRAGKGFYNDLTEYTRAEAEAYVEEGQAIVLQLMNDKFGLGTPDRIEIDGFENGLGEECTSQTITFSLYYGEEKIEVEWNMVNKMVCCIVGHDLQKKLLDN